eukprot:11761463-Alexandrium_andersonii.AAC.1
MLIDARIRPSHAGIPDGPYEGLEPRPALLRVAGSCGRPPLSDTIALQATGRVPMLFQHGLRD